MIRIINISRISLLSGRTNVYNLAKTCEALNAQENFRVKFVTTDHQSDAGIFFRKMGIREPFEITCLGSTSTASPHHGRFWFLLIFLWANLRLTGFLIRRAREFDALYLRDEFLFPSVLLLKLIFRKRVFFEIHSVLSNHYKQMMNIIVARFANGVIAISGDLKLYYQRYNSNIIVSLCSAAEDSWFDHSRSKFDLRRQLGLPAEAFIVGYTGVVGANPNNDYYEVDDIVRALALLPTGIKCVIVGELDHNANWLRDIAKAVGVVDRVIISSWQERSKIPSYLQAFDLILIPKRKKDLIGDSPAKMFPALAARRPIIAGRAKCIEEVLTNDVDALIVGQNNPAGWAQAILKIYYDRNFAEKISRQAEITRSQYTWEKRGAAIAEFIKQTR